MKFGIPCLIIMMLLSGCGAGEKSLASDGTPSPSVSVEEPAPSSSLPCEEPPVLEEASVDIEEVTDTDSIIHSYIKELAAIAAELPTPKMSEYKRTKAVFDYNMIEHTILDEPIGLELWRVHGGGDVPSPLWSSGR